MNTANETAMSSPQRDESAPVATARVKSLPLCVDLDGTLIRSNLLWECAVLTLRKSPASLLKIPLWLLSGGRPGLKHELAQRAALHPQDLPYNRELMEFLHEQREHGKTLVLVTGADEELAQRVAEHTGLFDQVCGTTHDENLTGTVKAEFLRARYGDLGFEYAGNSGADIPSWKVSNGAYVVGSRALSERAAKVSEVKRWFPRPTGFVSSWRHAVRIHHWSKNLLMFLPLLLAHHLEWHPLLMTLVGTVAFGLCSSGVYLLNDLLDLHSDRAHPWKSDRPFASGDLSIASGVAVLILLFALSFGIGITLLHAEFVAVLALYVIATTWYSLRLKKVLLLDVFVLSSFYSLRIWAGGVVTNTPLSQWFLGFSLFFFLSLSMAKRYSELLHAETLVENGHSGRGYRAVDQQLLSTIGVSSCFAAVVILSLYVHSEAVLALYRRPQVLLLLCPLILYWTNRLWLKAHRGELNEDPVTLAIRDAVSYYVALAGLGIVLSAS